MTRMSRAALVAVATLAAVPALAPAATTPAKPFDCEASAVRGSVLGQAALEPAVANRGVGACKNASSSVGLPAGLPVTIDALAATTEASGAFETQKVLATGGIGNLRVPVLPDLGLPALPTAQLAQLAALTIPLPSVGGSSGGTTQVCTPAIPPLIPQNCTTVPVPAAGVLPSLPSSITIDLRPAINALLPGGKLPNADLLRIRGAVAFASGSCATGKPVLTGASQVGGINVLGQELPVGQVVDQALKLLDTQTIDPSQLDLSKVTLPAGLSFTDPLVGTVLQNAVKGVLASLPKISIPATLAQVKVTPGAQTKTADALTQQALRVQVSVAGQSLLDLVVGEAKVSSAGVACAKPTSADKPTTASQAALQCTKRRLVLTDVLGSGRRVRLLGAADKALIGKKVGIFFRATGKRVATVTVRKDGSFSTTAPMPPASVRATNSARYQARYNKERSLDLKLQRRMVVQGVRTSKGKVTIRGKVTRPLGSPVQRITLTRRISCKTTEVVKRFKPKADGTFSVTVTAPKGGGAVVYRLGTKVRKTARNPKLFPTFTLPRAVELS